MGLHANARCTVGTALLILCGCQHTLPSSRTAALAGLRSELVQGDAYKHVAFVDTSPQGSPLYVFIEGDGLPWRRQGSEVSTNPTPHRALALALAIRTPGRRMYLGRPCYFSAINDRACNPRVWTSERFSPAVVASMAAVVNRHCADGCRGGVVLIGYSGGGVLAVLMAAQVPSTLAVITIAADLDTDAWTRVHGYSPLSGSLNPAALPALPSGIREWHLVGDRDSVVPPDLNRRYFDRIDAQAVWHFAEFDHVCCWEERWPGIFSRIQSSVAENSAQHAPEN
jgi:hypothetical protein